MNNPLLWEEVQASLDDLTEELDYGYIIGGGKYECSLCARKAGSPEDIKHEDGCIAAKMDSLVRALSALKNAS